MLWTRSVAPMTELRNSSCGSTVSMPPGRAVWQGLHRRRVGGATQQRERRESEHGSEDEMPHEERTGQRQLFELLVRPRKHEIPHHEIQDGAARDGGGDIPRVASQQRESTALDDREKQERK